MTDERLKIWLTFVKFLLGTFVLGLVSTIINGQFQKREIELKEQEQVGEFLDHALQEDVGVRRRFAQYFATVTRSSELRERWTEYYKLVNVEYQKIEKEKQALEEQAAKADSLSLKERERLSTRISELEQALSPRTSKADTDLPIRVYLQIAKESQRQRAEEIGRQLEEQALNIRFQGVELVNSAPSQNELRYYRRGERAIAETIQQYLAELGVDVSLGYVRGYENSNAIRPHTFEIWFSEQGL